MLGMLRYRGRREKTLPFLFSLFSCSLAYAKPMPTLARDWQSGRGNKAVCDSTASLVQGAWQPKGKGNGPQAGKAEVLQLALRVGALFCQWFRAQCCCLELSSSALAFAMLYAPADPGASLGEDQARGRPRWAYRREP